MKVGQGKAVKGFLSYQYVFVYLRTRSELLRDLDRFRELSLDLSKKNRAVPAVCVIVARLVDIMRPSNFSTKKEHRSKFALAVLPC